MVFGVCLIGMVHWTIAQKRETMIRQRYIQNSKQLVFNIAQLQDQFTIGDQVITSKDLAGHEFGQPSLSFSQNGLDPRNTLTASRCIYTKHNTKSYTKYNQSFPAPICQSWSMEGNRNARYGDPYVPANGPNALSMFASLNSILLDSNHNGVPACKSKLAQVKLRNWQQKDRDPLSVTLYPAMWADEMELFMKTLANIKPNTYLEWGSGGSSRWLVSLVRHKVFSVDNHVPWCRRVRKDPFVACLINEGVFETKCILPEGVLMEDFHADERLTYSGSNIPASEEGEALANSYVNVIDLIGEHRFDVILVDGRLRLACALKALNFVDEDSIVMIHDFWSRLHHYGPVLRYYDVLGQSRTAVVLRKKTKDLPPDWTTVYQTYTNVAHVQ